MTPCDNGKIFKLSHLEVFMNILSLHTKVSQLQFSSFIYEEVLWFQVPVQHLSSMAICQTTENLVQEQLQKQMKRTLKDNVMGFATKKNQLTKAI